MDWLWNCESKPSREYSGAVAAPSALGEPPDLGEARCVAPGLTEAGPLWCPVDVVVKARSCRMLSALTASGCRLRSQWDHAWMSDRRHAQRPA